MTEPNTCIALMYSFVLVRELWHAEKAKRSDEGIPLNEAATVQLRERERE